MTSVSDSVSCGKSKIIDIKKKLITSNYALTVITLFRSLYLNSIPRNCHGIRLKAMRNTEFQNTPLIGQQNVRQSGAGTLRS